MKNKLTRDAQLFTFLFIAALLLGGSSITELTAQEADNWTLLGRTTINTKLGEGEIKVVAAKADIEVGKIKLKVKAAPLDMNYIVIHYRNGEKQRVGLKKKFKKNTQSRDIPLRGDSKRAIKKVELGFNKKEPSGSQPKIELFGV